MSLKKSIKERFLHSLAFEVIAVAICAPLGVWLLGYSLAHIGALTLMISLAAMIWNMVFNALFDRAQRRIGFERTIFARGVHALMFVLDSGKRSCLISPLPCSSCPTPLSSTGRTITFARRWLPAARLRPEAAGNKPSPTSSRHHFINTDPVTLTITVLFPASTGIGESDASDLALMANMRGRGA